jgi:predicted TPR repeat methyltransferase
MEARPAAYDAIVSADTLVYFGALERVIAAAAAALRPAGLLVFTVEKAAEGRAPDGYRIEPHGRYSHAPEYIERLLGKNGLAPLALEFEILRMEGGVPVEGVVVTARSSGAAARQEVSDA